MNSSRFNSLCPNTPLTMVQSCSGLSMLIWPWLQQDYGQSAALCMFKLLISHCEHVVLLSASIHFGYRIISKLPLLSDSHSHLSSDLVLGFNFYKMELNYNITQKFVQRKCCFSWITTIYQKTQISIDNTIFYPLNYSCETAGYCTEEYLGTCHDQNQRYHGDETDK